MLLYMALGVPVGAVATPGLVPVRFSLARRVSWGEGLALVGGTWALGDWDPAQGLRLTVRGARGVGKVCVLFCYTW
jgi:hypothetical protein